MYLCCKQGFSFASFHNNNKETIAHLNDCDDWLNRLNMQTRLDWTYLKQENIIVKDFFVLYVHCYTCIFKQPFLMPYLSHPLSSVFVILIPAISIAMMSQSSQITCFCGYLLFLYLVCALLHDYFNSFFVDDLVPIQNVKS